MATTSQATPQQAQELFEPILKEGKQILHISLFPQGFLALPAVSR